MHLQQIVIEANILCLEKYILNVWNNTMFINYQPDHKGAVIIHEVNDGGAAQKDGRLRAGDQLLEVL